MIDIQHLTFTYAGQPAPLFDDFSWRVILCGLARLACDRRRLMRQPLGDTLEKLQNPNTQVIHMSASSEQSRCSFILELCEERSEYVMNKLREFNRPRRSTLWPNPPQPSAPLQIYALDDKGSVVGGLIGQTNEIPEWLEVSVVWVAEDKRRQGMGLHLMCLAEEEAKRRGCRYARLATGDYQAPDFYRKVGYRLYGELENCPRGETVYYFYKELV